MNPISRLFIYIIFSFSILISKNMYLLCAHFSIVVFILLYKRFLCYKWWEKIRPYLIYLPLSGILFFIVSFMISSRSSSILFVDMVLATVRLSLMVSLMSLYIIESKSQSILHAMRSLWFASGLNYYWIDRIVLFFEMTIRFFPSMEEDWNQTQRSQRALSLNIQTSRIKKIFKIAQAFPDFILLNLERTDKIVENMSMRGYGKNTRRSIFPFLKFRIFDIVFCLFSLISIMGIHYFV